MSERGVFAVDRGVWDHPLLQEEGPLSRREAWLWLLSDAAWKVRTVTVAGRRITLARGQLAHSIRFFAEAWRWPKSNVSRFLDALESEAMIGTDSGTGVTVITIRNYDRYQRVSLPDRDEDGTQGGTVAGQQWDRLEDTKGIKEVVVAEDAPASATPVRGTSLIRSEALSLADEIVSACGHDPKNPPPEWYGVAMRVETWLAQGWRPELILPVVKAVVRKRGPPARIEYFEKPIASEIARQAVPLPQVKVVETPETIHVARPTPTNGLSAVLGKLRAAAEGSAGSDGSCAPVAGLLPDRRRA